MVNLVIIPTIVGIDIVLVVWLTNVQYADVFAVDELVYGLVALAIDVDTRCFNHILDSGVNETSVVVVSAITYLQGTVADVRLLFEELVGQVLDAA